MVSLMSFWVSLCPDQNRAIVCDENSFRVNRCERPWRLQDTNVSLPGHFIFHWFHHASSVCNPLILQIEHADFYFFSPLISPEILWMSSLPKSSRACLPNSHRAASLLCQRVQVVAPLAWPDQTNWQRANDACIITCRILHDHVDISSLIMISRYECITNNCVIAKLNTNSHCFENTSHL